MTNPEEVLISLESEWETSVRDKKPGRELDAVVAIIIMGWTGVKHISERCICGFYDGRLIKFATDPTDGEQKSFPHYSTDVFASFRVAEKMRQNGFDYAIDMCTAKDLFRARFTNWHEVVFIEYYGKSLAESICKAALLAMGVNGK